MLTPLLCSRLEFFTNGIFERAVGEGHAPLDRQAF